MLCRAHYENGNDFPIKHDGQGYPKKIKHFYSAKAYCKEYITINNRTINDKEKSELIKFDDKTLKKCTVTGFECTKYTHLFLILV